MTDVVVIAEKMIYKLAMHGHISSGGGIIEISNGVSIKFTAHNEKFVTLQILHTGIGKPIKTQSWVKSKAVTQPKPKESTVKLTKEVEQEELI